MMGLSHGGARKRKACALLGLTGVTASILISLSNPAEAARRKRSSGGGYNPPYAAMVLDVKTGRTLHAENEDELRHPASVTKVMTLYMLFEQLERGRISLDTPLPVSPNAARQAPSKLHLDPGESITVDNAIKALVTKSANDVAVVVAEYLAGSEEAFAEQMTRKARSLGMSRTVYRNASGLPDPEQVTTARDLTILARAIQERFPRYYAFFQTSVFRYAGASHRNHNKLLGRVEGVDGIKTGFTRASGFNLMTNVKTDDRHIVGIVLGGKSGASRDQIMASLVRSNLPRAYAGARTAPVVATAEVPAPRRVASADPDSTAATFSPPPRRVLDPAAIRPVVASAAGASSTTTPSSTPFAVTHAPMPLNAQAYAALQQPLPVRSMPAPTSANSVVKIDDRLPAVSAAPAVRTEIASPARVETRVEPKAAPKVEPRLEAKPTEPKLEASRTAAPQSAWVIQLGATDDQEKAMSILERAKSRAGRALASAAPFTEKVTKDGATLYRARFSGFSEADDAQDACTAVKRSGFACFATRS